MVDATAGLFQVGMFFNCYVVATAGLFQVDVVFNRYVLISHHVQRLCTAAVAWFSTADVLIPHDDQRDVLLSHGA